MTDLQVRPDASVLLRATDGRLLPLEPGRWHNPPTSCEDALLRGLDGPALDVGCGPGRIVERLIRHGVMALGIDPSAGAVAIARRRGCPVLQRSVFDRLPGEGRWSTVLLFDGNVGIGGDPVRLLTRCRTLMGRKGRIVAEVDPPGTGWLSCNARLERGGEHSPWFPWSVVGVDALPDLAAAAGLAVERVERRRDDRWFADLRPLPRSADGR